MWPSAWSRGAAARPPTRRPLCQCEGTPARHRRPRHIDGVVSGAACREVLAQLGEAADLPPAGGVAARAAAPRLRPSVVLRADVRVLDGGALRAACTKG